MEISYKQMLVTGIIIEYWPYIVSLYNKILHIMNFAPIFVCYMHVQLFIYYS